MKIFSIHRRNWFVLILSGLCLLASPVIADDDVRHGRGYLRSQCGHLPDHDTLKMALMDAVAVETSGYDFHMWAVLVNRDGIVCAVVFSGPDRAAQLPGARVVSAQKAYAANSFSADFFAVSTANGYTLTQPGNWGYGLYDGNPVDTNVAYRGPARRFGQPNDPMVGRRVGGAIFFGGGLALYDDGRIVGGLGTGGDTPCADHMIAWRVRHSLSLDEFNAFAIGGNIYDPTRPDNIVYDIVPNPSGGTGFSPSGMGHPPCLNMADPGTLPPVTRN
ncbi:MAG: heme-binding protein [Woeseiaceae bacterium]|nr:heme-binding protein [Woeseiaceae bacterium]